LFFSIACRPLPSSQSLYEDARIKLDRGETAAALQEANSGLHRFPNEKDELHWRFLTLKAKALHAEGHELEALSLLQAEMPENLAKSDSAVWRKLIQGAASSKIGSLDDAERYLKEAEDLAKANHAELLGEVALKYGTLLFWEGKPPAAESAYQRALELARAQKDVFLEASALTGLGAATTMQGHYDESVDWNRMAAEVGRSVGAQGSLAKALGNTGWSYIELGDYETALNFFKQAVEASIKSDLLSDATYWSAMIAWAHQGLGDDAGAETILKQVLPSARAQDDKRTLAQCLSQLAWISVGTKRNSLAEEYVKEASNLESKGIDPKLAVDSILLRGLIAFNKGNYGEAEEFFQNAIHQPRAVKYQQWKAEAELANLYAAEGLDAKAEKEYRLSLATIEEARASIQSPALRLSFLFNTIEFYNHYVEYLISRHRAEEALQLTELSRARTLAEGLGAVSTTLSFPLPNFHPQAIAKRRNAVLLVYWLAPQQSYLWVIAPEKTGFFTIAKQSEIESLVNQYRGAMQSGKDLLAGGSAEGQKLYTLLVAPAEKLIPKNARVIVLADAKLHRLNFETLLAPGPAPHFWIEDVTVTTASSLTLLASGPAPAAKTEKQLLLVGNTDSPNQDFPSLAQAPQEMKNIEQYFPEGERVVLERKQATPKGYLESRPERFKYIHFVTHGTSSSNHPLESAVILSPEGDAYKLYAREIVQHHLNADLVAISACNGAGTQSYSGEGLVGLSWAFVRAGAHNVISALWEVSDVSTPQLMDSLYGGLTKGEDPATALREAKQKLLHSGDAGSVFRKPYYWAPFQLYAGS
jgi:CHAT domain-containing protein